VIGSSDAKGHSILDRKVTPQDIAATVFTHLGINIENQWEGTSGRPIGIVAAGGEPIHELI
jgi:hypothetical protein